MALEFSITTLRYPEVAPRRTARINQFTNGSVTIALGEIREAEVTVSLYDPVCQEILPLERFLFVRYMGWPVFWGPIVDPEWNLPEGTVTIKALGPEFRMQKHFLGTGDTALNGVTQDGKYDNDKGLIFTNANGMWKLVQSAQNFDFQTERGVPDLGILRGTVEPSPNALGYHVTRGNQTWSTIQNVSKQQSGPEFEIDPLDYTTDLEGYATFNTVKELGTDKTDTLIWHYGWGLDNLSSFIPRPTGSAVVTHKHTLSSDGKHRGTASVAGPSARFGVYVEWDALQYDADDATLADYGKKAVLDYGEPPEFFEVALKEETDTGPAHRYIEDFVIGDLATFIAHKGYYRKAIEGRIMKVKLTQGKASGAVLASLDVVPNIVAAGGGDEQ